METESKDNKIVSVRKLINEEYCRMCKYGGPFCSHCVLKNQLILLEGKNRLATDSTLEQVFAYCKSRERKYNVLCDTLSKYFSNEEHN